MAKIKSIITDIDKLSARADEVNLEADKFLIETIVSNLKSTLRANSKLSSLTAPQIGYNRRIFCINFEGDIHTFINPMITDSKGLALVKETCISIPGKVFIRPRNEEIVCTYQTPTGTNEVNRFKGLASQLFQHAMDHLEGISLLDIGLEIDDAFDKATDEERNELLDAYMKTLDTKKKALDEEIEKTPELKQISDAIKFMEGVQTGKITLEDKDNKK